jgi:hypothetical protein
MHKLLIVVVAICALSVSVLEGAHIGNVFEQKSFYSYRLKVGDLDANSEEARAHIKNAKSYGYTISLRLWFSAAIFGSIIGAFGFSFYNRRKSDA